MSTITTEDKARKQARARARRLAAKGEKALRQVYKPLEEWDDEELARGRPRAADGSFRGLRPGWISAEVHEEALRRFKERAQSGMRALVPTALDTIQNMILNDEVDEKGKPIVPPSVKLDAAKWVVEHLVGKPQQRVEMDISVKLQSILGNMLVQEDAAGELVEAIEVQSWEEDEDEPEE